MSTRTQFLSLATVVALTLVASAGSTARAAIVGPYTVDANTMHLFHFDETSNPISDDPGVVNDYTLGTGGFDGGNVGTLGHASFDASFGTAGRTNRVCCGNNTGNGSEERGWTQQVPVSPATLYGSDTTAFTIETMLKFNQLGLERFCGHPPRPERQFANLLLDDRRHELPEL